MAESITIGKKSVGPDNPSFIVAEIGINHNGSVNLVKEMVDVAMKCEVDAVKFQVFRAEEFVAEKNCTYTYYSKGKKITKSMLEMFKGYEFSLKQWREIFDYCKEKKVDFFITPQNPSDLDKILSITNLSAIKVGSDDLTNIKLLNYYASKKIPLILSTGMANLSEIEDAVIATKNVGRNLILLHCISSYPADPEEVNLKKMLTIQQAFDVIIGFSDHTIGSTASIGAVILGANIIEKHFTLDKSLPGPDHWFSADPNELQIFVSDIRSAEKMLGSSIVRPTKKEEEMRLLARRSIVASRNILKGEIIAEKNTAFKRPGTGLPPKYLEYFIGKKANNDIKCDELILFNNIC